MTNAAELVAPDPLLHHVALPLQARFYPLGFPVEIYTNHPGILAAAEESWRTSQPRFAKTPIRIRIAVADDHSYHLPPPPVFRAHGHLLAIVSDSANFAVCDFSNSFAFGWLGKTAALAKAWTRHFLLDAIVYANLTHLYLTAIHASCVSKNGRGVLLCAHSGAGKSVLALACARNGWTFVTDDVAYVLRETRSGMILGKPQRMQFLPSAAELFPDVGWTAVGTDQNGHPFVELLTADLGISVAQECRADSLVFLRRSECGPARLLPVKADDAFQRLLAEIPVYEKSVHEAHRQSLGLLSNLRRFELHYDRLDDAVRMLNQLAAG